MFNMLFIRNMIHIKFVRADCEYVVQSLILRWERLTLDFIQKKAPKVWGHLRGLHKKLRI
jgi:hypothetical protein